MQVFLRLFACLLFSLTAWAFPAPVVWTSPGKDHRDSMPLGNGDIGANVWTEEGGDLVLLIGKTDAWSENGQLQKIGQVRIRSTPALFAGENFRQTLDVASGRLTIESAAGTVIVWIDANRPAIHVECKAVIPTSLHASLELWRLTSRTISSTSVEAKAAFRDISGRNGDSLTIDSDTILPPESSAIRWAHQNIRSIYPAVFQNQHLDSLRAKYPDPLLHRIYGAQLSGPGLQSIDEKTLQSIRPSATGRIDIVALTEQPVTLEHWSAELRKLAKSVEAVPIRQAREEHEHWWREFWDRSWINVSGDQDTDAVTQSYAMQRYMVACAGRGMQPMKYNGSIFTIGNNSSAEMILKQADGGQIDPDYRAWGSNYWTQNQRLLYWPLIPSGDFDLLKPFFNMYRIALPLETDRVRLGFGHAGASYPETMYFWGTPSNVDFGWGNPDMEMVNPYIRRHINGGLELTMMMLDAFEANGDEHLAREVLLPVATGVTTYFDLHWKRDASGKLRFDRSQSLETDRPSVNPMPDVAGLYAVLPRLLALPHQLTATSQRALWQRVLKDLPSVPRGTTNAEGKHPEPEIDADPNGKPILWTARNWTPGANGKPGNVEDPELYAVFPYRLFGVDLLDLQVARNTFDARRFTDMTCWTQGGIDAADLGLAAEARRQVVANFTAYGVERFRWFWKKGHDWEPDLDNGGAGMIALQQMILQVRSGGKMILFPAWPKEWNVDFKLHGPGQTTVEGSYRDGKVQHLTVNPKERLKDLAVLQTQ